MTYRVGLPMEADIHHEYIEPDPAQNWVIDSHHKITQITLNPDHEALGSFVPALAEGTKVIDRDHGIEYTWLAGRLVPDVDAYPVDLIQETVQEIKDQNQVPPGLMKTERTEAAPNDLTTGANRPPEAQTDGNEGGQGIQAQSRSIPVPVLIAVGLLIVLVAGLLMLRRRRISEK